MVACRCCMEISPVKSEEVLLMIDSEKCEGMVMVQADRSRVTSKLDVYPCPEDVGKCFQNRPLGTTMSTIAVK